MSPLVTVTGVMLVLMLGGVWVAAALGLAGAYGLTELLSFDRMISVVGKMAWQQSTSFILVALPLFILMGEVMLQAGIMQRVYNAASKLVAALPGGLLQTNIAASMIFAACTGSSLASAATIGSVGYPHDRGARLQQAAGARLDRGRRHARHPDSAEHHLHRLRHARGGLDRQAVPGRRSAGTPAGRRLFRLYRDPRLLNPALAPREPRSSWAEIGGALVSLWPIIVLVIVVLGGIYGGVASPTEIAALAAALTFIFAAIDRKLTFEACVPPASTPSSRPA